ncbi:FAD-dependent oxidoreductase [Hahella sp. KA22]|uniref:FAD-dependent oxidoreductase n=1 Tax=Hahella sp. KA22 TaxID=1628392 RepID=UPI0013E32A22|nr:FAD-dependent oxidoreductase [Hahella sp. KA22]
MTAEPSGTLTLLLLGGGHTHALLLLALAKDPLPNVRVVLVSERPLSPYSGMLPGLVAGHYDYAEAHIDLLALCRHSGAEFLEGRVKGLDCLGRMALLESGEALRYDYLSLNIGAVPDLSTPGASGYAIPVKPIADFWPRWRETYASLRADPAVRNIVVVGGGAGGVELAFAIAHALQSAPVAHCVALVARSEPVADYPQRMRRWLQRRFDRYGVKTQADFDVAEVRSESLVDKTGRTLPADHVFWCTQGKAAPWLTQTELPLTSKGFIRVTPSLQSIAFPEVFAVGDCAWIDASPTPRAGVYAVRQAPFLLDNLHRLLRGLPMRAYRPQRRFLSLLACGGRDAVGARGCISLAGEWVWRWKDVIDKRFMRRFPRA